MSLGARSWFFFSGCHFQAVLLAKSSTYIEPTYMDWSFKYISYLCYIFFSTKEGSLQGTIQLELALLHLRKVLIASSNIPWRCYSLCLHPHANLCISSIRNVPYSTYSFQLVSIRPLIQSGSVCKTQFRATVATNTTGLS